MRKFFAVMFEVFAIILLIFVGNTFAFGYYWLSAICLVLAALFTGLADELK